MKLKLTGLETFDNYHLIALICTLVFIIIVPMVGLYLNDEKKKRKFILYLIYLAVIQEVVDYVSRINFDGLNLAEDLPLHICSYALIMCSYALYNKDQFCFEFSYLMGVTGTFFAILTPEFNDFDDWTMYVTYFIYHGIIIAFSMWNIFVDKMKPGNIQLYIV